jgi:hypothetical protein
MRTGKTLPFAGVIAVIVLFTQIWSCTHDPLLDNIPEICFDRDVLPVFLTSCAIQRCHNGTGESGLILTSYVSISRGVEPGKPYASAIYKSIISTSGENKMPPIQPLSAENRIKIRLWIEQGAAPATCADTSGQNNSYYNPLACFSRDILPVLLSRCASTGCHDAITHKEGYNYTSYSSARGSVTPGNPATSKLYSVIKSGSGENKMPPAGKPQLTTAEIDSIAKWISYGALDQNCGETCDTLNPVTFSGTIWPIMQSSCTGCHTGAAPGGGVLLANYNNVAAVAANGTLINALNGKRVTKMPPGISFSACRIRLFEIWVKNGHLNN